MSGCSSLIAFLLYGDKSGCESGEKCRALHTWPLHSFLHPNHGNGEVAMSVKGLDLLTGKKELTEAQKGLSFGRLSKEQEEVELRCWKPKKGEE